MTSAVAEVAEVDENAGGRSSPITIRLNEETFCTIQAVDSMNRPLAGLRVLRDELPVGETDAQGRCRIDLSEDAPAVMVHVEGAGYARTSRMLVPPARYRGADVEMRVPMALTTTLRLVDRTGRLVPDVGLALAGEGQDMQATHSDFSAGLFTFEETGPGSHRVVLAGESVGDWVLHPPVVVEGGARDVVVVADRIHPSRSRLILRLVDAATGAPLRPASVRMRGTPRLEGGGVLPWRFLDDVDRTADGVDAAAVPPGEYVLELTFDGRPEVVVPVEVEAGRALLEETVRVSAGATLVVELDGFDLAAGAGAIELELRREAWFEWDAPRPVALVGRPLGGDRRLLRVEGLAAGRGELRVRAGGREWVTPVEVPATGEGWVRVDME